jgi:hypothetical protein
LEDLLRFGVYRQRTCYSNISAVQYRVSCQVTCVPVETELGDLANEVTTVRGVSGTFNFSASESELSIGSKEERFGFFFD